MNDQNDQIEGRISRHLHNQAPLLNVGAPSVIAVTRRAAQRRIRRRAAVGVMSTAAVSAGTIFGIQTLSGTQSHRLRPAGTPTQQSPGGGAARLTAVDSSLVWNAVVPDSTKALGSTALMASTGDGFIAWSTQPGRSNDFVPKLYRSSDGVNWTVAGDAPNTGNAHQFTSDGNRLFSFATTAATAPTAPTNGSLFGLEVGASDDAGATWQPTQLPVDLGDLSGLHGKVGAYVTPLSIAAGKHGILAVADVQPKLSTELQLQLGGINGFTADGVLLADRCVGEATTIVLSATGGALPDGTYPAVAGESTDTATAGTAQIDDATSATSTTVVTSRDGVAPAGTVPPYAATSMVTGTAPVGDATASTTPAGSGPPYAATNAAIDSTNAVTGTAPPACEPNTTVAGAGPTVVAWADLGVDPATAAIFAGPPRLFISTDGTTFTPATFPAIPDGTQVNSVMSVATDDGFAVSVSTIRPGTIEAPTTRLFTSTDGSTWTAHDLGINYVWNIGQLADGAVSAVGSDRAGSPVAAVLRDGVVHSSSLHQLLLPTDGASSRLSVNAADVGPTGITVVGSTIVDAVAQDGASPVTEAGVTTDGVTVTAPATTITAAEARTVVLHSSNGVDWSREDLDTLTGFPMSNVTRIQSTATKVVITLVGLTAPPTGSASDGTESDGTAPAGTTPAFTAPGAETPMPKTVVLVGTPKR